jgi:type II secretory pathway pseudopilin PulG
MVVIASIAIPMVNRARKAGVKTRVAADLQAIGVSLDAYRNDFGDYPRFTPDNDDPANLEFLNGAEILCLALIGPRSANGADLVPANDPSDTNDGDGADGPGFRTTIPPAGTTGARRAGRTWGPYIEADKFKLADPNDPAADAKQHDPTRLVMLSYYGTPIVYLPSRAQKPAFNVAEGYVATPPPAGSPVAPDHPIRGSMWDVRYASRNDGAGGQVSFFRHEHEGETDDVEALDRIRAMMGDINLDGDIDPGETALATGGYALWSAGHDDQFGPHEATHPEECDDVMSFR